MEFLLLKNNTHNFPIQNLAFGLSKEINTRLKIKRRATCYGLMDLAIKAPAITSTLRQGVVFSGVLSLFSLLPLYCCVFSRLVAVLFLLLFVVFQHEYTWTNIGQVI